MIALLKAVFAGGEQVTRELTGGAVEAAGMTSDICKVGRNSTKSMVVDSEIDLLVDVQRKTSKLAEMGLNLVDGNIVVENADMFAAHCAKES